MLNSAESLLNQVLKNDIFNDAALMNLTELNLQTGQTDKAMLDKGLA